MNEESFYTVTASQFKEQLKILNRHNYYPISLKDFIEYKKGLKTLPQRPIIITFDDGHRSNFKYAFPILDNYNFKAIFFVVTEKIGSKEFMSWEELKEISNNGIEIGSHGRSHRFLSKLNDSEIRKELVDSKNIIEDKIEKPVKFLAIPGGFYNHRVEQIAKEVGYEAICTSDFGTNSTETDLFHLKRMAVRYDTQIDDFSSLFHTNILSVSSRKLSWTAKYILKNVIGIDNYTALKELILRSKS